MSRENYTAATKIIHISLYLHFYYWHSSCSLESDDWSEKFYMCSVYIIGDCIEMKGTIASKIPKLSCHSHMANLKLMVIAHA